jgi:hypothetical protein
MVDRRLARVVLGARCWRQRIKNFGSKSESERVSARQALPRRAIDGFDPVAHRRPAAEPRSPNTKRNRLRVDQQPQVPSGRFPQTPRQGIKTPFAPAQNSGERAHASDGIGGRWRAGGWRIRPHSWWRSPRVPSVASQRATARASRPRRFTNIKVNQVMSVLGRRAGGNRIRPHSWWRSPRAKQTSLGSIGKGRG